jgi:hypothetical protein
VLCTPVPAKDGTAGLPSLSAIPCLSHLRSSSFISGNVFLPPLSLLSASIRVHPRPNPFRLCVDLRSSSFISGSPLSGHPVCANRPDDLEGGGTPPFGPAWGGHANPRTGGRHLNTSKGEGGVVSLIYTNSTGNALELHKIIVYFFLKISSHSPSSSELNSPPEFEEFGGLGEPELPQWGAIFALTSLANTSAGTTFACASLPAACTL